MKAPSSAERHDQLLAWASERGSGTWPAWKQACAALSLEAGDAARATAQLGHVEFDWANGRFACAPTTLVTIPGLDGYLLATGARPTDGRERLLTLAAEAGLDVEIGEPIVQPGGRGPSTLLVECAPSDGAAFAALAGVELEPAPELLPGSLPELSLERVGELRAPDARFAHCLVDPVSLRPRWGADDPEQADGLWLFSSHRQRFEHYLRREESWWHLPIREHGPYLVAPAELDPPLLEYEQANRILRVRSRAPLPPLQARAATLCSGRMPLRRPLGDEIQEMYVNVDSQIAASLATSLGAALHQEGET